MEIWVLFPNRSASSTDIAALNGECLSVSQRFKSVS